MSSRLFDNPNNIPVIVVKHRIGTDDDAIVFQQKNYDDDNNLISAYIAVDSDVLTDIDIETILSQPLTQAEINYLADVDAARQELRNEYDSRITRLTQIINVPTPSPFTQADLEQLLLAIKDIATNQRGIIKLLSKQFK